MSEPIRLLLGVNASRHQSEVGAGAFVVIGKASYPDDPKRWALHLVPTSIKAANDATAVAQGTKVARKPPAKKASPAVPRVPAREDCSRGT